MFIITINVDPFFTHIIFHLCYSFDSYYLCSKSYDDIDLQLIKILNIVWNLSQLQICLSYLKKYIMFDI